MLQMYSSGSRVNLFVKHETKSDAQKMKSPVCMFAWFYYGA